jgi:hypothetical protein
MSLPGDNGYVPLPVDFSDTPYGPDRSYGIAYYDIIHVNLSCCVLRVAYCAQDVF